ncbi:hypothetical protein PILCRDRAFT_822998 [Piloderma croceum F 1598]|uniref:Uncharacterized protein n=1 Tax=Piloderma croceum (strain F 1598) TaxID=765440 RepID=A0A0C3F528_PILCF|nr:hypothetical protein PILCRDRAFT_822998 [Piloderma croceum F 1598]
MHCGIAARISIYGDIKRGKGNEGQQEMERTVHSCGDLQVVATVHVHFSHDPEPARPIEAWKHPLRSSSRMYSTPLPSA